MCSPASDQRNRVGLVQLKILQNMFPNFGAGYRVTQDRLIQVPMELASLGEAYANKTKTIA